MSTPGTPIRKNSVSLTSLMVAGGKTWIAESISSTVGEFRLTMVLLATNCQIKTIKTFPIRPFLS